MLASLQRDFDCTNSPAHQMYPHVFEPSGELILAVLSWEGPQALLQCAYWKAWLTARCGKLCMCTTETQIWILPLLRHTDTRPTGSYACYLAYR